LVSEPRRRRSRESDDSRSTAGAGKLLERQGVGTDVFEYRIDFGPGYRVDFGKDGDTIVILLAGGTKKRQDRDIADAHERWADYKKRKAQEK
jgi:putative addiction module killer protein